MHLLDNRPVLRFQAYTRHSAGMYQCIAMNGVGNPATATIQLRILCEYHLKRICYPKVMMIEHL
jgi:hypothetical protein